MKITDKHKKLLREIRKNPRATLKELGDVIGVSSPSTVALYRNALIIEGLLRRVDAWEIVEQPD